jgi:hypothetical protein
LSQLEVTHAGRRAIVTKNDAHPEYYLWIDVDGKRFFLGVLEKHMMRGDVKRMAERFLERAGSGR